MPELGRDFKWTEDGDIELDETGDFALATPVETVIQDVEFRVRSDMWDYEPDPLIAAGLSRFKGKPNNRQTGDAIKEAVYYCLTKDGRFGKSSLFVDVVPYSRSAVVIFVFVQDYIENTTDPANPYDFFKITYTFDLDLGLISRITGQKE